MGHDWANRQHETASSTEEKSSLRNTGLAESQKHPRHCLEQSNRSLRFCVIHKWLFSHWQGLNLKSSWFSGEQTCITTQASTTSQSLARARFPPGGAAQPAAQLGQAQESSFWGWRPFTRAVTTVILRRPTPRTRHVHCGGVTSATELMLPYHSSTAHKQTPSTLFPIQD